MAEGSGWGAVAFSSRLFEECHVGLAGGSGDLCECGFGFARVDGAPAVIRGVRPCLFHADAAGVLPGAAGCAAASGSE